jgi:hypothetical protein
LAASFIRHGFQPTRRATLARRGALWWMIESTIQCRPDSPDLRVCLMPRFSIQVSQGKFSNAAMQATFENGEAARREALAIFADLARDISAALEVDSVFEIEIKDEARKPIFRIRLLVESPGLAPHTSLSETGIPART